MGSVGPSGEKFLIHLTPIILPRRHATRPRVSACRGRRITKAKLFQATRVLPDVWLEASSPQAKMFPERLPEPANAGPQAGGRRASLARSGRAHDPTKWSCAQQVKLVRCRFSAPRKPRPLLSICVSWSKCVAALFPFLLDQMSFADSARIEPLYQRI